MAVGAQLAKEEVAAATKILLAVAEAIREAGELGIPSGHLYGALAGQLSGNGYCTMMQLLKREGVIREKNHVLYWAGKDMVAA